MINIEALMKVTMEKYFKREVDEIFFRNGLYIIHIETNKFGRYLDEMYSLYEVSRFGVVFKTSYVNDEGDHIIENIFVDMEEAQQYKK